MLDPLIWLIYMIMLFIAFFQVLLFLEKGRLKYPVKWRDNWPSVALIVPAYNEEDTIEMTLESILDVEYPDGRLEVVVVNDGSEDSTGEKVKQYAEEGKVELINQENQGKGAALNKGIEKTEGEIVCCVDADSYLDQDSLKNIVSELEEDMAAVTSAMKAYKPSNLIQKVQWVEYMVSIFLRYIIGLVNSINVAPGPLSIYRRKDLREVGGFDEDSLVEDQEICYRLQNNQKKVGHSRSGEVFTVTPATLKDFYNQRYRWYRGTLETIIQYRGMFLNKKYGDFGLFMMPAILAQGVLSILGLILMTYLTLSPFVSIFKDFVAVGFNIFNFSDFSLQKVFEFLYWELLSQRVLLFLMLGSVFLLSLFTAYLASKHTEEKLFKNGYLPPLLYLVAYIIVVGSIWLKAFIDIVLDMEADW